MALRFPLSSEQRAKLMPIIPDPALEQGDLVEFNEQNKQLYNSTCGLWERRYTEFNRDLNALDRLMRDSELHNKKADYIKYVATGRKMGEFLFRLKKTIGDLAAPAREPGIAISLSADALDEVQQQRSKIVVELEALANGVYVAYNSALEGVAKIGRFNESDVSEGSSSHASSSSSLSSSSSSASQWSASSVSIQASSSSTSTSIPTPWIVVQPNTQTSSSSTSTSLPISPPSSSSILSALISPITNLFATSSPTNEHSSTTPPASEEVTV